MYIALAENPDLVPSTMLSDSQSHVTLGSEGADISALLGTYIHIYSHTFTPIIKINVKKIR